MLPCSRSRQPSYKRISVAPMNSEAGGRYELFPATFNFFERHIEQDTQYTQSCQGQVESKYPPPKSSTLFYAHKGLDSPRSLDKLASNDRANSVSQGYKRSLQCVKRQVRGWFGDEPTKMPWYFPRSRKGTISLTIACAMDISPPPPIPMIARKAMSCGAELASEAPKDPKKKTPKPNNSTHFRDQISERRP
jgi:hypothetical protein